MVSRRVKLIRRLLSSLEKAPLSTNKGEYVRTPRYISRKDKKHSGWVTPRAVKKSGMSYKEMFEEGLEPQDFYDDWKDWRDGQRNYFKDASHYKKHLSPRKREGNSFMKEWQRPDRINKKLDKEKRIRHAIRLKRMKAGVVE